VAVFLCFVHKVSNFSLLTDVDCGVLNLNASSSVSVCLCACLAAGCFVSVSTEAWFHRLFVSNFVSVFRRCMFHHALLSVCVCVVLRVCRRNLFFVTCYVFVCLVVVVLMDCEWEYVMKYYQMVLLDVMFLLTHAYVGQTFLLSSANRSCSPLFSTAGGLSDHSICILGVLKLFC